MSALLSTLSNAKLVRCLAAVLVLTQVVACASGGVEQPVITETTPPIAPLPIAPVLAASVPVVPPVVEASPSLAPIIIRGNDRLVAPSAAAPAITGPASAYKFEDAPSTEVVHVMLRDILKVDYVVYPPLPGTITLATRGTISADRALLEEGGSEHGSH